MNIIPREEWGALPSKRRRRMTRSDGLAAHEVGIGKSLNANVVAGDFAAVAEQLRNMQRYHMTNNGWSDIAYSFIIDQLGRVWEGRGWGISGGHTAGANSTCHGVLFLIGDGSHEAVTPQAAAAARELKAEHDRRYGHGWWKGHQEVAGNPSGTSCPGSVILGQVRSGLFEPAAAPPALIPEEDPVPIMLSDSRGKVWLVSGNVKAHVPTPDHMRVLEYLGVRNLAGKPNDLWLESLGTLPSGLP